MATLTLRPERTRKILMAPESTVGTYAVTSGSIILPARGDTAIAPADNEPISNSDLLDGYAGEIAATAGARGMSASVVCEIRDYVDGETPVPFTPWMLLLGACGWEMAHSGTTVTMVPSTKQVTDWPGMTAGSRSPLALSLASVYHDNGNSDELTAIRGATGSAKIDLSTNGIATITAELSGLVQSAKYLDVGTTNLTSWGVRAAGESVSPLVVRNAAITAKYVDGSGSTAVALHNLGGIELDMGATVERIVDPTSADGYAPSQPVHETAPTVNMKFADTSALAESVMAGYYSQRGFFDVDISFALGGARTLKFVIPRIQYAPSRESEGGLRMFSIAGKAVREYAGKNDQPPVKIEYTYA